MRLYRENLALKVQLDALAVETTRLRGKRARASLRPRAAQVWAYLATRANRPFQKHHLSASPRTIKRRATKLRQGPWQRSVPRQRGGRPPTRAEIVELVITLKRDNPGWGQKKLAQTLRRLGIPVSAPTVQKILEDNGFGPPGGDRTWEEYTARTGPDHHRRFRPPAPRRGAVQRYLRAHHRAAPPVVDDCHQQPLGGGVDTPLR